MLFEDFSLLTGDSSFDSLSFEVLYLSFKKKLGVQFLFTFIWLAVGSRI
jgi:hypothetical protein